MAKLMRSYIVSGNRGREWYLEKVENSIGSPECCLCNKASRNYYLLKPHNLSFADKLKICKKCFSLIRKQLDKYDPKPTTRKKT